VRASGGVHGGKRWVVGGRVVGRTGRWSRGASSRAQRRLKSAGVSSVGESIRRRDPCVSLAVATDVAEPRERDVRGTEPVALLVGVREDSLTLVGRGGGVEVEAQGDVGTWELDLGRVDRVPQEHQLLVLALNDVIGVTGCVTRVRPRTDARVQFGLAIERFETAFFDVGIERRARLT